RPCPYCPYEDFTPEHLIQCLHMYRRFNMPLTIDNLISFFLDQLPLEIPKSPQLTSP
ncbi:uncharacterized protein BX663DRAFT_424619, partial [Cokeromyces recurvatus]|uniref:uncharacterized protein n=1 Tax=Cokeromyces recurvatus TaxID=90255 RepID=UPI002220018C